MRLIRPKAGGPHRILTVLRMIGPGLFAFLALASAPTTARGELELLTPEPMAEPGEFQLGLAGSYLRTSTNIEQSGARETLPYDGQVQSVVGKLFLRHGTTRHLTLFAEADFVTNIVDGTSATANGSLRKSVSGPGDSMFGIRYAAALTPLRLMLEGSFRLPLYSRLASASWSVFDESSSTPTGSGAAGLIISALAEVPLAERWAFGTGLGFSSYNSGFANSFPYQLYARYSRDRGIFARLGLAGWFSANNDSYSHVESGERAQTAMVGSAIYNGLNPSMLAVEANLGLHLSDRSYLTAGLRMPVAGREIPADPMFLAAFAVRLGGQLKPEPYPHSNRGFQQYYLNSQVIQANNELRQILIDRGATDGIRKGEYLDIFEPDPTPGVPGRTIARAQAIEVGPGRSKLQIKEDFIPVRIEEGFVVRRPVH